MAKNLGMKQSQEGQGPRVSYIQGHTQFYSTNNIRGFEILSAQIPSDPCTAGNYMTDSGCEKCEENHYSGDEADSCTECPYYKTSPAESTSVEHCTYGNYKYCPIISNQTSL